jgi:hypothetical protein
VARGILVAGALVWLLGGVAALILAALAVPELERSLPPLAIDTDALRGAVVALGSGLLAVGVGHLIVVIGLNAGRRWGSTTAILLAALLSAVLLALAAASATSAVATPEFAAAFVGGALAAGIGAAAYAIVVVRLVTARRSGWGI